MSNVRKKIKQDLCVCSFRLSKDHIGFLEMIAKQENVSQSHVLRTIIDSYACHYLAMKERKE